VRFPAAALRLFALCLLLGMAAPAHSQTVDELYPQVKDFFPQADRFGEIEGKPPLEFATPAEFGGPEGPGKGDPDRR